MFLLCVTRVKTSVILGELFKHICEYDQLYEQDRDPQSSDMFDVKEAIDSLTLCQSVNAEAVRALADLISYISSVVFLSPSGDQTMED